MKYKPEDDGITHINIYSKGKTELGRMLSNFAYTPFEHPLDGKFSSVEGYWYWLVLQMCCNYDSFPSEAQLNQLKILWGLRAKKFGKELCAKYIKGGAWMQEQADQFESQIKKAFIAKVSHNKSLEGMIVASELPFTHYYNYNGKVVEPTAHKWQVLFWENLRKQMKIETLMDFVGFTL